LGNLGGWVAATPTFYRIDESLHSDQNNFTVSGVQRSTFNVHHWQFHLVVRQKSAKLRPNRCLDQARVPPSEGVSFADGDTRREERWDRERRFRSLGREVQNSFTKGPPIIGQRLATVIRTGTTVGRPNFMINNVCSILVKVGPPSPTDCVLKTRR